MAQKILTGVLSQPIRKVKMAQAATWATYATATSYISSTPDFNEAADVAYGSFLCLCFLIGTLGNLVSFIYFVTKKRDISSVIYIFITANDILVSITALPVGISFISQRQPGILFGNRNGCLAWIYVWNLAVPISVFLVLCLSTTRTISLVRPFRKQKIRYLIISVVLYFVLMLATTIIKHYYSDDIDFSKYTSRGDMVIDPSTTGPHVTAVLLILNLAYIAPAFVVAASCVISMVVLSRRNNSVRQGELRQSRNRATVTILLFALIYGVCNLPFLFIYIVRLMSEIIENPHLNYQVFKFDRLDYYFNAASTLLLAANSAANPVLYFWRMPALRERITAGIRKIFGLDREVRNTSSHSAERATPNASEVRIIQNIVAIKLEQSEI